MIIKSATIIIPTACCKKAYERAQQHDIDHVSSEGDGEFATCTFEANPGLDSDSMKYFLEEVKEDCAYYEKKLRILNQLQSELARFSGAE